MSRSGIDARYVLTTCINVYKGTLLLSLESKALRWCDDRRVASVAMTTTHTRTPVSWACGIFAFASLMSMYLLPNEELESLFLHHTPFFCSWDVRASFLNCMTLLELFFWVLIFFSLKMNCTLAFFRWAGSMLRWHDWFIEHVLLWLQKLVNFKLVFFLASRCVHQNWEWNVSLFHSNNQLYVEKSWRNLIPTTKNVNF